MDGNDRATLRPSPLPPLFASLAQRACNEVALPLGLDDEVRVLFEPSTPRATWRYFHRMITHYRRRRTKGQKARPARRSITVGEMNIMSGKMSGGEGKNLSVR